MNTDPLAQLKDIHLPEPIGIWPPALGWWLLLLVVTGLVGFGIYYLLRKYLHSAYRRAALKILDSINKDYQRHNNAKQWLNEITQLLKRTCMKAYPSSEFAELSGTEWLNYLDSKLDAKKVKQKLFTQSTISEVFNQQFQPETLTTNTQTEQNIINAVTKWIKKHQ
ncbi:MAG TPA: DUF4381 domain-containing protein [Pseudomonadales bacterium]